VATLGLVLRSVLYEEKNRMVTILTEEQGRITLMAKNAVGSRRFGGTLDLLSAANFEIKERPNQDIFFLESATIRKEFRNLRSRYETLTAASVIAETLLKVAPERTPTPELFRLAAHALQTLDDFPKNEMRLLMSFFYRVLVWSGIQPRLDFCFSCQEPLLSGNGPRMIALIPEASVLCASCSSLRFEIDLNREIYLDSKYFKEIYPLLNEPFRIQIEQMPSTDFFLFLERLFRFHVPGFDHGQFRSMDLYRDQIAGEAGFSTSI